MFDPEAEEYPADPGVDEIDDTNYSTDHPEPDDVSCPDEFSGTDEAENLESEGDSDDPPVLGAAPEAVLATRWVPLDQLTVEYRHWVNPRRFTGLDDEAIGELASDISSKTRQVMTEESETTFAGISEPLDVIQILEPSSNARIVNLVIDGQRRERAARRAYKDDPDVLIPVRDLEPAPVIWTAAFANRYLADSLRKVRLRAGLSAFELAKNAELLRDQIDPDTLSSKPKAYTLGKIGSIIGRSESWVSKILTSLKRGTPKLIHAWETGVLTEEQFRDLAAASPASQSEGVKAVSEAQDPGEGRAAAKEQKELARARRSEASTKLDKVAKRPVVRGPQAELPPTPPRKPPPFAVVEDMLATARKHPPTSDYVKGMMDGVRWATGVIDAAELGKSWKSYMQHVSGDKPKPTKPAKAGKAKKKR